MSARFALVEAQVSILRQCRMIALIRPIAGVAEDDNGNLSPICYTDFFMLEKSNCAPVEEFFTLLNSKAKTSIFKTKRTSVVFENKFSRFLPVFTIFEK